VPELEMCQVDINRLVREVLALYQTTDSGEDGVIHPRISLELAGELTPVRGDPARLRQVIHNLLQNAQDALIVANDPSIIVRTELNNSVIELSVTDNGKGFSKQV